MSICPAWLICFAVEEEAKPFRRRLGAADPIAVVVTGMGRRNAEAGIRQALARGLPVRVLTCGFAGGLRPDLSTGTVLYSAEPGGSLSDHLRSIGISPGRFHCASRVAVTAKEKADLWQATGADAVEMESEIIASVCKASGVPCATVRVILDTAAEDLPLDFNALMDEDQKLSGGKLALAIASAPGKIPALMRLNRQTRAAAERLAEVLDQVVEAT